MLGAMGSMPTLRALLLLGLLATALLAAGCGGGDDDADEAATTAAPAEADGGNGSGATGGQGAGSDGAGSGSKPERERPKGTVIKAGESQFGQVLFDGDEQAIYLFDKETSSKSECYGDCAAAWPPVLTKGRPEGKGAVSQGKLGTTKRDDGKTQVTYAGHPLYYYHDEGPTEVRCHNVPGFGGLWLALTPSGEVAPT